MSSVCFNDSSQRPALLALCLLQVDSNPERILTFSLKFQLKTAKLVPVIYLFTRLSDLQPNTTGTTEIVSDVKAIQSRSFDPDTSWEASEWSSSN